MQNVSESKSPTELKNARREGLDELARTAAADVINAKSAEGAPVRLAEGVKCIGLKTAAPYPPCGED